MSTTVPISKKLVLINSASSVATRLLNVSVMVWMLQYLLKRIDPDEYALLPVVMAVMMLVPLMTTFLTAGLSRYITEAYAKGDEERVTQITSTMFPLLLAGASIIAVIGAVLTWRVDDLLTIAPDRVGAARFMLGLMVASSTVTLPFAPFGVGLFVRQKFVLSNLIELGSTMLRITLLLGLLLGIGPQVKWVVVSQAASGLAALMATSWISQRLIPSLRFRPSHVRWDVAKQIIGFNTWYFWSQLASTIRKTADPLILNELSTTISVTSFHIGSIIATQISRMSIMASQPLEPVMTAMHAKEQKERLANLYLRGGRVALWMTLLLIVPLIVYRNELLRLYLVDSYATYASAASVMILLLGVFPLSYAQVMLPKIARATAIIRLFTMSVLAAQLINLLLTILLVGRYQMGALGSALATFLVALIFNPFVYWPLGLKLLNLPLSRFVKETLVLGWAPAIATAVVLELLRQAVEPNSWLTLGGCILIGFLTYLTLLTICLTTVDRKDITTIMRKIRLFPKS